ncbi:1-acyl-sn-glycerol-3-phosphate acyltransferase [Acrasis kona]|uniref:1-acyl-sn-glycerol-3-phosphate acyltransferase n=1 Tax=Acrasis kona TaxID=1008807 RepID=A0AAW2ZJ45_9EUKA
MNPKEKSNPKGSPPSEQSTEVQEVNVENVEETPFVHEPLFPTQTASEKMDNVWYGVRGLALWCIFLGILALINILQLCLLPLWYLGYKKYYMLINTHFAGLVFTFLTFVLEYCAGLKLEFSGDKIPDYESALIISNHVSAVDCIILLAFSLRKGMIGSTVFLTKKALRLFPLVGWAMWLYGFIFLQREWGTDASKLEASFKTIKELEQPLHLVTFLEGTRITEEKLKQSTDFATKRGLAPTKKVLLPRIKGLESSLKALRSSHVKYLYDVTLGYPPLDELTLHNRKAFSIYDMFGRDLSASKVCVNVKRIKITTIPQNAEELSKWAYDRFYRKDKLLVKMNNEASAKLNKRRREEELLRDSDFMKNQARPKPIQFYQLPGETLQNEPYAIQWWGSAWDRKEEVSTKKKK